MRFFSCTSEAESTDAALGEVIVAAKAADVRADVLFVFFTAHHRDEADSLVEKLWLELDPQAAVGSSAEGVIGGDVEIERTPGLVLLVGHTPGVRVHPFHLTADDEWNESVLERMGHGPETRAFIGFGDPFTTPLNPLLAVLDEHAPQAPLIGGMASSARQPGENALVRNDQILESGFVGVSLAGPIEVDTVVSQGARPIGRPMVVTKAQKNVIEQLGGKPALAVLREVVDAMPPADKQLLRHGLLVGRAMSEYKDSFARGDFVIRNLMGVDQESGAMAVTDLVKVGQTVQFHVRDATSADEDLAALLDPHRSKTVAGGLLFSCNGRGMRLFDAPCHDIAAARAAMPQTPMAGFFAAGEIGPVGGKNFVHGHTASFALFRPTGPRG
jgi:small ligand-binding sensory domain FIST